MIGEWQEWAGTEAMHLAREHSQRHTGGVLNCPLCQAKRSRETPAATDERGEE